MRLNPRNPIQYLIIGVLLVTLVPLDCQAQQLESLSTVVKMQQKDVRITVYYYSGEKAWGQHIFDINVEVLPILEDLIGIPYPHDFDVVIYPKRSEDINMWNAQNRLREGIWINRDRFTPDVIRLWSYTTVLIHETVHYWSDDAVFKSPWLKEGYCELFAYLALEKMGREEDAARRKREWSRTVEEKRYYSIPLDVFEYEAAGPGNETTVMAYSKSALFCCEIYERYGLEPIQKINQHLFSNGIQADSFTYMNLLEEYTGEDQKELFMEWVFPKRVDLEVWERAEAGISELNELTESSLSYIEHTYGFDPVIDFVEFNVHIITQGNMAHSYIEEYECEKALQIINGELEELHKIMAEFDGYALQYYEAEDYYNRLQMTLGEIDHGKLLAARDSLLSFRYDLYTEYLAAFYEEMEILEMYQTLYSEWCAGEGCTSFTPLDELLSDGKYEEVLSRVDRIVTVVSAYEAAEQELARSDWLTLIGFTLLRKRRADFESDLENAQEDIKNGSPAKALEILTCLSEELSKARKYGVGIVLGGALVIVSGFAVVSQKKKKRIR
jgi:hypothetical protein